MAQGKGKRPRSTLTPVAQILPSLLERMELPRDTVDKGNVLASWDRIAGDAAARCRPVRFRGTTLVVEVEGPAWMTELSLRKAEILARIARTAGPDLVTDLRFTVRKVKD